MLHIEDDRVSVCSDGNRYYVKYKILVRGDVGDERASDREKCLQDYGVLCTCSCSTHVVM